MERKDSNVGRTLKKLISRRGKYFTDAEKHFDDAEKEPKESITSEVTRNNTDDIPTVTVEYKDGWIDLPSDDPSEKSKHSMSHRISSTARRMSISGASMMRRKQNEQMSQAGSVETKQNDFDDTDSKKRSKSMFVKSSKSIMSFKIKTPSAPPCNERYDNGAFSLW